MELLINWILPFIGGVSVVIVSFTIGLLVGRATHEDNPVDTDRPFSHVATSTTAHRDADRA